MSRLAIPYIEIFGYQILVAQRPIFFFFFLIEEESGCNKGSVAQI
jgi:hypothetical protein